jgi:CoA-transferase family III
MSPKPVNGYSVDGAPLEIILLGVAGRLFLGAVIPAPGDNDVRMPDDRIEIDRDRRSGRPPSVITVAQGNQVTVTNLQRQLDSYLSVQFNASFVTDPADWIVLRFGSKLKFQPRWWDDPVVVLEVALGKRCARMDLRKRSNHEAFAQLLRKADILVHGYRPDALALLGFDADQRHKICPGLVDVTLDAYGWTGPWKGRRGFDSLVQMSSGIADHGMKQLGKNKPTPLPVQALDHSVGYLMATAAIRGLTNRLKTGAGCEARTPLARMAAFLMDQPTADTSELIAPEEPRDLSEDIEETAWGPDSTHKAAGSCG